MKTLIVVLCLLFASVAQAQTQTATYNLSWTDNSTNETGFKIERCTGAACSNFLQVGQTGVNGTVFSEAILNDSGNVTQCYRVRAFNASDISVYSFTSCGTSPVIFIPAPNNPSGVAVTVTVTVTTGP